MEKESTKPTCTEAGEKLIIATYLGINYRK